MPVKTTLVHQQEEINMPQKTSTMSVRPADNSDNNTSMNSSKTRYRARTRKTAPSGDRPRIVFNNPNPNKTEPLYCLPCAPSPKDSSLQNAISKISNAASVLCVLDCTILPIITILLPLLGFATSPSQAEIMHELGHSIALFFVIPVGGLTATMNYLSHANKTVAHNFLSLGAVIGLSMIYVANGGHDAPFIVNLPHEFSHTLHCNEVVHRIVNVVGCVMLLGSSYLWHRVSTDIDGRTCCIFPHFNTTKKWNIRVTIP